MNNQPSYLRRRQDCSGVEKFILDICNLLFYAACAVTLCLFICRSNYIQTEPKISSGWGNGKCNISIEVKDKITDGKIMWWGDDQFFVADTEHITGDFGEKVFSKAAYAEFEKRCIEDYQKRCLVQAGVFAAFAAILYLIRKKARNKILGKI